MDANKQIQLKHKTRIIAIRTFLIAFLLFISGNSFSQDLNQKISITLKNVALIDVINEISNIGHVNFSYRPQSIPVEKKISIKAKNKTIKDNNTGMISNLPITAM